MVVDVCPSEFVNKENICSSTTDISKISDEDCGVVDADNVIVLPPSSTFQRPQMGPVTPDCKRENREQIHDFSSPGSLDSSLPNLPCFSSHQCNHLTSEDGIDSQTPKESVFDPFAPGPDKFMFAPQRRNLIDEIRNRVVRRLNFAGALNFVGDLHHEPTLEEITSDEEHLFETILEAIVTEQTKELVAGVPNQVSGPDGFMTPHSAPCLSGTAGACPGAPMKLLSRYRNIDKELCRKLEF